MAAIGLVTFELRLDHSHSLKDKRQVVKSLKDRLRARFNVAVAEIDGQELWQRGVVAAVTISSDRGTAEQALERIENAASDLLGPMLVRTEIEWIEGNG